MKFLTALVAWLGGSYFQAYLRYVSKQQESLVAMRNVVEEPIYDFYRCAACHRLLTKLEEFSIFDPSSERFGQVCPCQCRRYSPTNLLWYEWLLPRVWKFALIRVLRVA